MAITTIKAITTPMTGRMSLGQRGIVSVGRPAGGLAGPEGRKVTRTPSRHRRQGPAARFAERPRR
ncbi:MAG TPA: hypothetical protein VGA04_30240 [Streptosporangiaceae bacterium]